SINKNQGHGIYFDEKVNDTQITGNNITDNRGIGVALDKSGANTYINGNNINGNRIGININHFTDNLVITQNKITGSIWTGGDEISGIGVNFGVYYQSSTTFNVENNAIFDNQRREVEIRDTDETVVFGLNWYGHSDWNGVKLCPKLKTQLMKAVVTQSGDGFYTVTLYRDYDNRIVADKVPAFETRFQLNDGTVITVLVENGIARIKIDPSLKLVLVKTTYQRDYPENIKFVPDPVDDTADDPEEVPGGSSGPGTGGSGGGTGDGAGSSGDGSGGTGDGTGGSDSGSGNSGGGTTSGSSSPSSIGAMAAAAVQGSTDSSPGESGSSSGSRGSAQELFINDPVRNPQIWGLVGIVVLIFLVIVAYYRKDLMNMIRKSK
ncbi:MAG TPA: right-handed parallel beta-helix repeat-containing protein, partial [Methanobacterium sp.]